MGVKHLGLQIKGVKCEGQSYDTSNTVALVSGSSAMSTGVRILRGLGLDPPTSLYMPIPLLYRL